MRDGPNADGPSAEGPSAKAPDARSWRWVREWALARIRGRDWAPGERIPDEAVLAAELGCARSTVNRALRDLAAAGLLERRRKGGTRVAALPVRRATFEIPIIRLDIEARGRRPGYRLLASGLAVPPEPVRRALGLAEGTSLRHVMALHLADERPFCLEDRWLNPAVEGAEAADFASISANEWLVRHVPFSKGSLVACAGTATADLAARLGCAEGAALFALERTTWIEATPITWVRLSYEPSYRLASAL